MHKQPGGIERTDGSRRLQNREGVLEDAQVGGEVNHRRERVLDRVEGPVRSDCRQESGSAGAG